MKRTVRVLIIMGKLAVTASVVALIAFGFGVLSPTGDIAESDADILALKFGPASNHQKMTSALDKLGHPEPWPLNINGNVVYFSTKNHREEPARLMEDYLRTFYAEGVNRADYTAISQKEAAETMALDAFGGGAVPLDVSDDHVTLAGVQTTEEVNSNEDLMRIHENHDATPDGWHRIFKGFRHVEMDRTGPETMVTSVWSDDKFDYEKMELGSESTDVNTDPDLPACPGCVRLNGFESLDGDRPYKSAIYLGGGFSSSDVRSFYTRALKARGWEPTEANEMMKKVLQHVTFEGKNEADKLQFARGGEFMTVLIAKRGDQFVATLSISD